MNVRAGLILLLGLAWSRSLNAQLFRSTQEKLLRPISDTLVLDSLTLLPGSVNFQTFPPLDSASMPVLDYANHALVFKGRKPDSVRVKYTRLPFNLDKPHFHKDPSMLHADYQRARNPYTIQYNKENTNQLFLNDGLTKNGNISRGISFGNNQDMVVNSNLNLQVSGKLTPDIDMVRLRETRPAPGQIRRRRCARSCTSRRR